MSKKDDLKRQLDDIKRQLRELPPEDSCADLLPEGKLDGSYVSAGDALIKAFADLPLWVVLDAGGDAFSNPVSLPDALRTAKTKNGIYKIALAAFQFEVE